MPDVVVIGSLNVDRVTLVRRLPAPGETVLGEESVLRPGGKGANQAMAAASCGAHVRLIGRVGGDDSGRSYLDGLSARGVDVAGVRVDEGQPTGTAHILVDDGGENVIVVEPGANGFVTPEDVERGAIAPGDVVLLQLEIPLETVEFAVATAHRIGAKALLNLSPFTELRQDTLDRCSVVLVNATEAEQLARFDVNPDRLVITRGARGACWGDLSLPAAPAEVIDTTGAGDAFAGALAAAFAAGRSRHDALARAIAFAGQTVSRIGAQDWLLQPAITRARTLR